MNDQSQKRPQGFSPTELISRERLERYRGKEQGIEAGFARYDYNLELSQKFYPLIGLLEVGLRNALYKSWAEVLGQNWILGEREGILAPRESDKILQARQKLKRDNKSLEVDRIIAELNFGFWTGLFHKHYTPHNHKVIRRVFPYAKNFERDLTKVRVEINELRRFRNRVFSPRTDLVFCQSDKLC